VTGQSVALGSFFLGDRKKGSRMEHDWSVEIESKGRCGYVHYFEGKDKISFDWEFVGTPLAVIWGPLPDRWDTLFPWAKGRRTEIMQRIAGAVIRQKAPNCVPEYNYDRTEINIRTA
jgi:hypothetical protein